MRVKVVRDLADLAGSASSSGSSGLLNASQSLGPFDTSSKSFATPDSKVRLGRVPRLHSGRLDDGEELGDFSDGRRYSSKCLQDLRDATDSQPGPSARWDYSNTFKGTDEPKSFSNSSQSYDSPLLTRSTSMSLSIIFKGFSSDFQYTGLWDSINFKGLRPFNGFQWAVQSHFEPKTLTSDSQNFSKSVLRVRSPRRVSPPALPSSSCRASSSSSFFVAFLFFLFILLAPPFGPLTPSDFEDPYEFDPYARSPERLRSSDELQIDRISKRRSASTASAAAARRSIGASAALAQWSPYQDFHSSELLSPRRYSRFHHHRNRYYYKSRFYRITLSIRNHNVTDARFFRLVGVDNTVDFHVEPGKIFTNTYEVNRKGFWTLFVEFPGDRYAKSPRKIISRDSHPHWIMEVYFYPESVGFSEWHKIHKLLPYE